MNEVDLLTHGQELVEHVFDDPSKLLVALTHSSIADTRLESNERLEFLGDAVLGLIVCEDLYRRFPDWLEGDLTKVKSAVVSRRTCATVSDEIGLTDLLILGKGVAARSNLPVSLRAAVFESVVGALFLDGGFEAAKPFVLEHMRKHIDKSVESEDQGNHKSALQQYAQRWLSATPQYETLDEQGPDHSKCFEVCVAVAGERYPSAWGPSKKAAEQEAARRTLDLLRQQFGEHPEDAILRA
ncbi:MAG: ribonuclease III [Phycisphaerales bacterium]|nr:MAG: ribonuclease III [Phycisphaerales bacterium]